MIRNKTILCVLFTVLAFNAMFARNELSSYVQGDIGSSDLLVSEAPESKDNNEKSSAVPQQFGNIQDDVKQAWQDAKHKEESGKKVFDDFAPRIPLELQAAQADPVKTKKEPERSIEFNFEDTDLQNLVNQISDIFDVTFIADDAIDPLPSEAKGKILKGNKISFKTQKPLSKQEAWNLFVTFLDLAGFALTPEGLPRIYRIKPIEQARRSPLSTYIGVSADLLPDSDEMIRYIYFIKKSNADTLNGIVDSLKSPAGHLLPLNDLRAFILTDKAYNVRSLLRIVKEIDQSAMPQSMSVLKLRQANAKDVEQLYKDLIKKDDPGYGPRTATAQRKQSTSLYFPENATIIAEPRSNALIILGPDDVIKKIEHFITKYVDIDLDQPYSPLFVYQVKYADAQSIAEVMDGIIKFGGSSEVGKAGGVRGGDKYFKAMTFTPERETNQLIIKADYDDYTRALEIIEKLDEPQPQVAIEVLLLSVDVNKAKELGAQIRTKVPGPDGLLGKNVNFQTSGIKMGRTTGSPIIPKVGNAVTTGAKRLLGNMLDTICNPSLATAGTTVLNFGVDACGVWGIFNVLDSVASTEVISNPFLVTTNKTAAEVSVGQTRRVVSSTVVAGSGTPQQGFKDFKANLSLNITPQINSDGMIVLDIKIQNEEFIGDTEDPELAAKTNRLIDTKTVLADQEVLAIGGLIQNRTSSGVSKVPVLGDIPVLGWLFKNKSKSHSKGNIVALISVRIIKPDQDQEFASFTRRHMNNYYDSMRYMQEGDNAKDPVTRLFFKDRKNTTDQKVDNLIFERTNTAIPKDPYEKPQLVAKRNRSAWANKRGRRKRRHRGATTQSSQVQETPQQEPTLKESFDEMVEKPLESLIVKKSPVRKTIKKRSMLGTFFEDKEGHA